MRVPRIFVVCVCLALVLTCRVCSLDSSPDTAAQGNDSLSEWWKKTYQDLVIGFAQIGAESEWRTASTEDHSSRKRNGWE